VQPSAFRCAPRAIEGTPELHFHHVHYNTVDPEADLEFFERLFGAAPVEFCSDEAATGTTRASKTERGWFLYEPVSSAPDPALNTYLEHVGWLHPSPNEELLRMVDLGATLFPEGRAQCAEAAAGMLACGFGGYWFYLLAPSGARIEVAMGPGPATSGFGHVHLIMGVDLAFYETVTAGAYTGGAIDLVNHTDVSLTEDRLANETVVETRGKPIDHIAYSTTELEAAKTRIEAAGIAIAEDIRFKDRYGFRSFFVKDAKGIWVEVVEDSAFVP
jgi:predicted enzyme related to lactoylglutathione lyase